MRAISPEIYIIEDAAQAFGAQWGNEFVGTQGDIGIYSFGAGKGLTIYQGGGLVARDPDIRTGLRDASTRLAKPSNSMEARRIIELVFYHLLFNPIGLALAYGAPLRYWLARGRPEHAIGDEIPDNIAIHPIGRFRRRVGVNALRRYSSHLADARQRGHALVRALEQVPSRVNPFVGRGEPTGLFLFATAASAAELDAVLAKTWRAGIGITKLFMYAIGRYKALSGSLETSTTPNADQLAATTLTITTSSLATAADMSAIVGALTVPER